MTIINKYYPLMFGFFLITDIDNILIYPFTYNQPNFGLAVRSRSSNELNLAEISGLESCQKTVSLFSFLFWRQWLGSYFYYQKKRVIQCWNPAPPGIMEQTHTFRKRNTRRNSCVKMLLCH